MARARDTAERILDVAEVLVQTRGYNGFAYKDIAGQLGIRNASIHFHYPTKADLGVALVRRYRQRFLEELDRIATEVPDAPGRLARLRDLFCGVMNQDSRLCLCGMMSAEMLTLPQALAGETRHFFEAARQWIADVLEQGRAAGEVVFAGPADTQATLVLSVLEGAMVVSRGLDKPGDFACIVDTALGSLVRPQATASSQRH